MDEEMEIPQCVIDRLRELTELCKKYPVSIPLPEAAKFYGLEPPSLREALINGTCPIGFGWQKVVGGNRAYCIPTHLFYVCNAPMMGMKITQLRHIKDDPKPKYIDMGGGRQ